VVLPLDQVEILAPEMVDRGIAVPRRDREAMASGDEGPDEADVDGGFLPVGVVHAVPVVGVARRIR
jgi:hypothetical protein